MSQKKQVVIRKKTEKVKDTVISEELLDTKKQSKIKFTVPVTESTDNKTHDTVQKSKKIIKKANDTKSSLNIFDVDNVDYRYIMTHYDFSKNKSRAVITQYEKALMIGKRATQIERGCHPNVKVLPGQTPIHIAEEELRQRKIPFIIERTIGSAREYWKPIDMEIDLD